MKNRLKFKYKHDPNPDMGLVNRTQRFRNSNLFRSSSFAVETEPVCTCEQEPTLKKDF